MAVTLPSGFIVTANEPIDNRIVLTKEEMLAIKKARMPSKYICVCKDDGKLYIYDEDAVVDPVYGRFKPYEDVIDIPSAITKGMSTAAGKAAMEEAIGAAVPGAIEEAMSTEEGSRKIADAMFSSEHFDVGLDNKIDITISLI